MTYDVDWLRDIEKGDLQKIDGLVDVASYNKDDLSLEEVAIMERAERYKAKAVFFKAGTEGQPRSAQAFIFAYESVDKERFALTHKQLWSWGGVPLAYLVEGGLVRLFRCAHDPDFEGGKDVIFHPFSILEIASKVANDPWWSQERLRNGSLWDDAAVAHDLLRDGASQKELIDAVKNLYGDIKASDALPESLGRKLLILSLLIAYLDERGALPNGYFQNWVPNATRFYEVLENGPKLVEMLKDLERRFNGNVFELSDDDRELLRHSDQLSRFARLIEGRDEPTGQRTLWARYSFADLPVELISQTYQLFVDDKNVAVYTPQSLVRLMVREVLSPERLDRLTRKKEVILDPACGSGVFLVEAYKRLVLHWRSKHRWSLPSENDLRELLGNVRGVDSDAGAVELASFSLCLAMCDALEPEALRATVDLFPKLIEVTVLKSCFFEAREEGKIGAKVGVVIGNPPFKSAIPSGAGQRASDCYARDGIAIPDKQIAFLFLHASMELLEEGGVLSMLQSTNFLYNKNSEDFRRAFFESWDVREVLDFASIRGMFGGAKKDPKVVVVVAEAKRPSTKRMILHATFRRSHRAKAKQGFDIDYYDLHWIPRRLLLDHDEVWRTNLLGGGRLLSFVNRLGRFRTLEDYVKARKSKGWRIGEGFVEGASGKSRPADHIIGKPLLLSKGISASGIDASQIGVAPDKPIEGPRDEELFTPPMVLVDEQINLDHGFWNEYLTFKNQVVGIRGPKEDEAEVREIDGFLSREKKALQAYVAATSVKAFTQHSTTLSGADINGLPYPESGSLGLNSHDKILVDDVVDYYRDLIRFGDDSEAMRGKSNPEVRRRFNEVFIDQVNAVFKDNPLTPCTECVLPKSEIVCQPYVFRDGEPDWSDVGQLEDKLRALLLERRGSLNITRIARIYDGACIYLLKPDRLRYWLRSTALRDADEVLSDLSDAGY